MLLDASTLVGAEKPSISGSAATAGFRRADVEPAEHGNAGLRVQLPECPSDTGTSASPATARS